MKKIAFAALTIAFFFVLLRFEEVSSKLLDQVVECFRQGQYHEVLRLTERRIQFDHDDILMLRALAFLKMQEKERAYPLILELSRHSSPLLLDHLYYLYLEQLIQEKDVEKIIFWVKEMEERFSHSPLLVRAFTITAKGLLRLNAPRQALSVILRSFSPSLLGEEKGDTWLLLAQSLQALGYSYETIWILRRAYQDFPQRASEIRSLLKPILPNLKLDSLSSTEQISFLHFFFTLGFFEEMKSMFSQIVTEDLSPSLEREYFILRVRVALRLNALTELEQILAQKKEKNTEEILFYQGVLAERRGQYSQAIRFYRQLLDLFPRGAYRFDIYKNLTSCYRILGKEQEYVRTLSEIISLFPQDGSLQWELFQFFYQKAQWDKAKEIAQKMVAIPEYRNRALFWLFKLDTGGSQDQYLQTIIETGEVDYYYVRAWQELKRRNPSFFKVPFENKWPGLKVEEAVLSSTHWQKYQLLRELHLLDHAEVELLFLHRRYPSSLYLYLELSDLYQLKGDYRRSILYSLYLRNRLPQEVAYIPQKLIRKIYPPFFFDFVVRLPYAQKFDPYLFLALVRAESSFQVDAVSPAGALGLAQVLPSTASWVVEKGWVTLKPQDLPSDEARLTYFLLRPEVNLEIGAAYFTYLLERLQGNTYFAVCAYNAGPGRVDRWIKQLPSDLDAFVEAIPFAETQNYLKRVIANYFYYSLLYWGDFVEN